MVGDMPPMDWREMDSDDMLGLPRGDWTISDDLADHLWKLTERSQQVGWGPDPPFLLETLMGFFPGQDRSSNLNSWFLTRIPGRVYDEATMFEQIKNRHRMGSGREFGTGLLYNPEDGTPNPLRSKLHGQQYTITGWMFTYDFHQWQTEEPSGFMRIPVTEGMVDEADEAVEQLPFERSGFQSRAVRGQYKEVPTVSGTFAHPHYVPAGTPTEADYMELFTVAFDLMERGVKRA